MGGNYFKSLVLGSACFLLILLAFVVFSFLSFGGSVQQHPDHDGTAPTHPTIYSILFYSILLYIAGVETTIRCLGSVDQLCRQLVSGRRMLFPNWRTNQQVQCLHHNDDDDNDQSTPTSIHRTGHVAIYH